MVSSVGDPEARDRGKLLRLREIVAKTGLADGTVRSKYHAGTMPPVWKLGRRLVAWEADLEAWLTQEQNRTTKHRHQTGNMDLTGGYEAMLEECPDLAALVRLIEREEAIRDTVRVTGETRETVIDLINTQDSMGQEAVLGLTDGAPTTLRAALQAYVDALDGFEGEATGVDGVTSNLEAILAYPYPGADTLEVDNESEDETVIISVNGREVARANHDEHGYAGMGLAAEVAHAVWDAAAK